MNVQDQPAGAFKLRELAQEEGLSMVSIQNETILLQRRVSMGTVQRIWINDPNANPTIQTLNDVVAAVNSLLRKAGKTRVITLADLYDTSGS